MMTRILNPAKRKGDRRPNFIDRVVSDVIVFRATDGEVMLGGQAKIGGEMVAVYTFARTCSAYKADPKGLIKVREVIDQKK